MKLTVQTPFGVGQLLRSFVETRWVAQRPVRTTWLVVDVGGREYRVASTRCTVERA